MTEPMEVPQWLTPEGDRLVPYDGLAPTLRTGEWHLHALHRQDGSHAGLVALRKPNGRLYYLDIDVDHGGDVLALQFIVAMLPSRVVRRLVELMHDYTLERAAAAASASSH